MKLHGNIQGQSSEVLAIRHRQKRLSAAGVLMIVVGILAIVMPVVSSLAVNFLVGAVLTFSGILALMVALSLHGTRSFVWAVIGALFPLCLGLYMLLFPALGMATLTALIAAILLLAGISQSMLAFVVRGTGAAGWFFVSGLISIVLGIVILAVLPEASTVLLGILLGIDLISTGLALIVTSGTQPRAN